jgi:hypothetical protein
MTGEVVKIGLVRKKRGKAMPNIGTVDCNLHYKQKEEILESKQKNTMDESKKVLLKQATFEKNGDTIIDGLAICAHPGKCFTLFYLIFLKNRAS